MLGYNQACSKVDMLLDKEYAGTAAGGMRYTCQEVKKDIRGCKQVLSPT